MSTLSDDQRKKEYRSLAALFEPLKDRWKNTIPETDSPLFNAMTVICKNQKMPTAKYESLVKAYGERFTQEDYARTAGFIIREVELPEKWKSQDLGPVLLLVGNERRPVALFRQAGTNYFWDSVKNVSGKLKKMDADGEQIVAYSLVRPLPAGKLKWKDIVIHSLHGFKVWDVVTLLIATALATLASLKISTVSSIIYGTVIPNGITDVLLTIGWFSITFVAASVIFSVGKALTTYRMSSRAQYAIQGALYDRLFHMEENYFKGKESAQVAYRTDNMSASYCSIYSAIIDIVMMLLSTGLYLDKMQSYSPVLTGVTVGFVALSVILTIVIGYFVQKNQMKCSRMTAEIRSFLYQVFGGIQTIRATGSADVFQDRYLNYYIGYSRLYMKRSSQSRISNIVISALTYAAIVVAYYYMGGKSLGIDTGSFLAFLSASAAFTGAMTAMASDVLRIFIMYPMLKDGSEILNAQTEQVNKGVVLENYEGDIRLDNVSFRYGGGKAPLVLNGIRLNIKSGEYIGIVGSSGCGKSTLLRIILGFERPTSGSIYIGKIRGDRVDRMSFRRNIGTVLQDGVLFSGSLYKNISISNPDATLEDVARAAEIACVAKDIDEMPLGLATPVSEESETLSGGQKQRIMLARAVLGNPKLLLLDEATSALDNVTQAKIAENLAKLGCTRIVVAHRLSTIRDCDRILVMDKGKIVEEGNFDSLMEKKGLFYELAKGQML